jgi:protein-S-isoprenylcysteine O-methyltransferase Ste14
MKKAPSVPMLIVQFIIAIPVMMAIIFWPAGTLKWAEGWIYLILQLGYAIILTFYFLKNNPEMIKKRMELKIPPKLWDKFALLAIVIVMTALLIIPGLDAVRYQWSSIPLYLEIIGFALFIISSYWIFLVMKENSYLLKTVEIQKNQKVVSTGPYKYVRHPMYSTTIIMVFSIALALGSLYTLIPAILATITLMIRTQLEDKTLQKELKGYIAYTKKTKYKIIPGIW